MAALHSRCEQSTSTHIVIACRDPWFHLVALLATHQAEKVAVFPNNFAQVTLRDLQLSATLLSDDANLNPDILVPSQWLSGFVNFTPKPLQANACQIELYTSGSTGKPKRSQNISSI
ncbi:hypothetical protein [Vibrio taketomensis]|uniref:hypothetical protein n=1 Tax=Vibrio taketomensis TaxID=2572923 RepID=UPI001E2DB87B|nr:hypothetical protein [Vibrio taketomensis]